MSRKKEGGIPPSGGTPEAEEFMALLISAQKDEHDCLWSRYFKKLGDRMVKQYTGDEKQDE
jgi:hypothetical protein